MDTIASSTTRDVSRYREFLQKGQPGPLAYVVLLGLNVFDLPDLIKLIDKGLPWRTLPRFVRNTGLSLEQVAEVITIPKRTLARRKTSGRLMSDESDRLLRAARIYSRALELFDGNREAATQWLTDRNIALGGVSPLEFARTEIGAAEVDHLVGRIEYGIFS
jgi:putative toxin-antitoxin system antitoxin component (TIGR02293 family)